MLRTLLFIILYFIVSFITIDAQELPPVINYSTAAYGGANQNWSITQADNKFVYVANNDGLLEFNGAKWTLHKVPNNTIVRSVGIMNDVVYSGSYMDFGHWKRDDKNVLKYTSLVTTLNIKAIEDEQFWSIVTLGTRVIFQSLNRIYIYNTEDTSIRIIESKNTIHKMFKVSNSIYFHVFNEGIYSVLDGQKVLVSNDPILLDDTVVGIYNNDDILTIITGTNGIYNLFNKKLVPYNNTINSSISNFSVYSSIQLFDGSIVLGTISNGLIRLLEDGTFVFKINQYNGLSDNTVLALFEDVENNLWIGLDNGIDCLNLNSPFKNYIDQIGNNEDDEDKTNDNFDYFR